VEYLLPLDIEEEDGEGLDHLNLDFDTRLTGLLGGGGRRRRRWWWHLGFERGIICG